MVMTFLLSGFEYHRFSNSLISNIYVTTHGGPNSDECRSEDESDKLLQSTLGTQLKFEFGYFEAMWTSFLTTFCCCLRKKSCFEKRMRRKQLF